MFSQIFASPYFSICCAIINCICLSTSLDIIKFQGESSPVYLGAALNCHTGYSVNITLPANFLLLSRIVFSSTMTYNS